MQYCLEIMKEQSAHPPGRFCFIGMFEELSYETRKGKTEVLPALGDIRLFSE